MSQSDLFAVTVLPTVQARVGALPLHVAPAEDEALTSWIISLAATLKLSPLALCRMVFEIAAAAAYASARCAWPKTRALICGCSG